MCGRARCTMRADGFARACHLGNRPLRHINMDRYQPSYNVAPGFSLPVVHRDGEKENGVAVQCMKWGLIPSFANKNDKIDHFKMFNARAESIQEKASFRRLIPNKRCLVCVEGFYEWKKDGTKKQPYYIHFSDGSPLVLAALFDSWKSSSQDVMFTFTIITTSSSTSLEWLHDRMPVILGNQESIHCWFNDGMPSLQLLKPYEGKNLAWYPVTPAMGKVSFDGPDCIREVTSSHVKPISQFFSKKEDAAEVKNRGDVCMVTTGKNESSKERKCRDEEEDQSGYSSTRKKSRYDPNNKQ
ncbi:hypothetical protein M569_00942, partial [Genlisea aurea]